MVFEVDFYCLTGLELTCPGTGVANLNSRYGVERQGEV